MSPNGNIRLDRSGFSLLELIIAITIMGIVATIATLNFHSWQVKSKVEEQTRGIYVDLNEARTNAFTQKRYLGLVFQPMSYVLKSYSTIGEASSPLTRGTVQFEKTLNYALTKRTNSGTTISTITDTSIIFDTSGVTNDWFTIFVDSNNSDQPAAVNCIVISSVRENMGKMDGTSCAFK